MELECDKWQMLFHQETPTNFYKCWRNDMVIDKIFGNLPRIETKQWLGIFIISILRSIIYAIRFRKKSGYNRIFFNCSICIKYELF